MSIHDAILATNPFVYRNGDDNPVDAVTGYNWFEGYYNRGYRYQIHPAFWWHDTYQGVHVQFQSTSTSPFVLGLIQSGVSELVDSRSDLYMEVSGSTVRFNTGYTEHYEGYMVGIPEYVHNGIDLTDGLDHTLTILYSPNEYRFFVDGGLIAAIPVPTPNPFQRAMYIIRGNSDYQGINVKRLVYWQNSIPTDAQVYNFHPRPMPFEYDGTNESPVTLAGVWNGSSIEPVTSKITT